MGKIILKIINIYQLFISPNLTSHCRFYPSCSNYTSQAIKKYGAFKGVRKGFWRLLRCNSFNKGGVDLP